MDKISTPSLQVPYVPEFTAKDANTIMEELDFRGEIFRFNHNSWPTMFPDSRLTTVYIAHDIENLYIKFHSIGEHLKAEISDDLGPVANDSCVEFFISPYPQTHRYWNFEFNVIGRKNVSTRIKRTEPRRLSPQELAQIKTVPSVGALPFGEKSGIHEWTLGVIVPLSLIGVKYEEKPIQMVGNFYKCGGKTSSPHYLSWSPIHTPRPDFHQPAFFAPITLL